MDKPEPEIAITPRRPWPIAALMLTAVTATLFAISVHARAPWFGQTNLNMAGAMTAGTCTVASHWHREGAWNLRFVLYWEPDAIETPTPATRTPYVSFPPGAVLPIHLLGKITGTGPTPHLVMAYNLANHLLVSLILGLTMLLLARAMGFTPAMGLLPAFSTATMYLFLPSPYFEHQMGYFSDQAVMLPFALTLLLEVLRRTTSPHTHKALAAAQAFVLFWGTLTDWLFLFIALCLYLVRLRSPGSEFTLQRVHPPGSEFTLQRVPSLPPVWSSAACCRFARRSTLFWLPPALAVALFLLQIMHLHAFSDLFQRFAYRTGMDNRGFLSLTPGPEELSLKSFHTFTLDTVFWKNFIPTAFGPWGTTLLFTAFGVLALLTMHALVTRLRSRAATARPQIADAQTPESPPSKGDLGGCSSPIRPASATAQETGAPAPNVDSQDPNCPPLRADQGGCSPPGIPTALAVAFIAIAPCFLYYQVFRSHSNNILHFFTTLKFALPIALLPFALLPLILLRLWLPKTPAPWTVTRRTAATATLAALLCAATIYLVTLEPKRDELYTMKPTEYERLGNFLRAHTQYKDIVFSATQRLPKHYVYYAMKCVYEAHSLDDIKAKLHNIDGPCVINLLSKDPKEAEAIPGLAALAVEEVLEDGYHLQKIPRRAFEKMYKNRKIADE